MGVAGLPWWLPWALVGAGVAFFFAAAWQLRTARRLRAAMAELERRAATTGDPLAWPQAAWPILSDAGLNGLAWHGQVFGSRVEGNLGAALDTHTWLERVMAHRHLWLEVRARRGHRFGREQWFAQQLWQLFLLHWRALLRERLAALDAALVQRAEHALLLRHDLRNFAQWLEWSLSDLTAAQDEAALLAAARRLARQAEAAIARARALAQRSLQQAEPKDEAVADLPAFVRHVAQFHGLELELAGDASTRTPARVWLAVLDNLFANLSAELRARGAPLRCRVALDTPTEGGASLCLPLPEGLTFSLPVARLFEPFASARPGGMGLGLYLARAQALEVGGELTATEAPAQFVLRLP